MNELDHGPLLLDEMMKIVSLMDNPPEAAIVRKALKNYEIPANMEFKWGLNKDLMKTMRHYANPQSPYEVDRLCELASGKSSFLEVGSSFGGTLTKVSSVLAENATVVSVDMDCDNTPKDFRPMDNLVAACKKIANTGRIVHLVIGDSHNRETVEKVRPHGPFDLVFIDGDHSYQGMRMDWQNYGPMGKVVAFHDIVGPLEDCRRAWQEIKRTCGYRTEEFVDPAMPYKFGIGVVYRE